MVMSSPHYLDKPYEFDEIYFPSQDSHPDSMPLVEKLSFQGFEFSQEDVFEFHNPIYNHLEASYLASPFSRNKFLFLLMFSKEDNVTVDAFIGSCRGLYDFSSRRKGKVEGWVKSDGMTQLSFFKK